MIVALRSSYRGECHLPIKKATITATKAAEQNKTDMSSRRHEEWANKCVKYQRLIRINVNKIFRFDRRTFEIYWANKYKSDCDWQIQCIYRGREIERKFGTRLSITSHFIERHTNSLRIFHIHSSSCKMLAPLTIFLNSKLNFYTYNFFISI